MENYSGSGVLPEFREAAPSCFEIEDCTGGCRIKTYTGPNEGMVAIPSSIDGKKVVEIGDKAFTGRDGLIGMLIPSGVVKIGEAAFAFCSGLVSLSIPNTVTEIGFQAFLTCEKLTSVIIPESVTEIGSLAFHNCDMLILHVFPGSAGEQYAKDEDRPFVTLHLGGADNG